MLLTLLPNVMFLYVQRVIIELYFRLICIYSGVFVVPSFNLHLTLRLYFSTLVLRNTRARGGVVFDKIDIYRKSQESFGVYCSHIMQDILSISLWKHDWTTYLVILCVHLACYVAIRCR